MARSAWRVCGAVLAAAALLVGCGRGEAERDREPGPARVVVSIPPLEGLCRALLPADAEVRVLVTPGRSPHGFEPTPSDVAAIARADLVVLVGMGIESGLPRSAREGDRVLTMAGALGLGGGDEHDLAQEGHDHARVEGVADPHLWLDPALVGAFVPALAERVHAAVQRSGGGADEVASRAEALRGAVAAVDEAYRAAIEPLRGAAIITQHGGWSRVADRYGLEIAGVIQIADAGEPTPGHIAQVVAAAKSHGARAVFTEPQLDAAIAERVAEQLGVPVGRLDPLGRGDWEAMMRANLEELVGTITGARPDDNPGAPAAEPGG